MSPPIDEENSSYPRSYVYLYNKVFWVLDGLSSALLSRLALSRSKLMIGQSLMMSSRLILYTQYSSGWCQKICRVWMHLLSLFLL